MPLTEPQRTRRKTLGALLVSVRKRTDQRYRHIPEIMYSWPVSSMCSLCVLCASVVRQYYSFRVLAAVFLIHGAAVYRLHRAFFQAQHASVEAELFFKHSVPFKFDTQKEPLTIEQRMFLYFSLKREMT